MKKVTLAVAAALALSALTSAYAATPGAYVGLGLGASRLDTPNLNPNITGMNYSYTQSRGGLGERIFAGYNFNPYIGAELGLANYAQSTYKLNMPGVGNAQVKYNMQALSLVAKGYLPVSNSGFNLYALAGAALVNSKVQSSDRFDVVNDYSSSSVTTRKVRPMAGVGASYDVSRNLTTSLEYSHIQGTGNVKTSDKAIPNADMVSFNVSYNFD